MQPIKEVTIYDIAEKLNLSPTTISRGLKDHPAINKKTKKRINDTALEMGYRSNTFASNLRSQRTHTIGVIIPKMNSNFMSTVLSGMEKIANEANYNLIISQSLESAEKEMLNIKTMFNNRVDGLMISIAYDTIDYSIFDLFINKNIPLLFFDRTIDHPLCPNIEIDNQKSAYIATKHLISQGCENIVHITGNQQRNVYAERQKGYETALLEAQLPIKEGNTLVSTLDEQSGIDAAEAILEMHPLPDAVFVDNDNCAANCMIHLIEKGIQIPEQIAFVGFNNDPIAKIIRPTLTTINYPGFEMGQIAAKKLIAHLNGEESLTTTNYIGLRSELIPRESSARIKSKQQIDDEGAPQ
ncbi:LacI family DNA-binding transcriptional regulator [Sphingobacterium sp. SYP-B4668]|uniref:LacI family DNA-binding transcriptional regulator n=1 Tax=Sphingobacterium sp. SYP-B4668 TaxID=2996035 RepID=UPI0022DE599B|nr:LacI family DNA-binding transcriptional regulator [Sphingobacterium sp. SYP-B4668]